MQRGVRFLCFSPSGKLLAAMGSDDENNVVVYDWERANAKGAGGKSAAIAAAGKAGREKFCAMLF